MKTARRKGGIRKDEIRKYKNKCLISGPINYNNKEEFEIHLIKFINDWGLTPEDTVFISTMEEEGPSAFIIDWCKAMDWKWFEALIDWSNMSVKNIIERKNKEGMVYNAAAPFDRNYRMSRIASHGLIFHDGSNKVIEDLVRCCNDNQVRVRMIRHN